MIESLTLNYKNPYVSNFYKSYNFKPNEMDSIHDIPPIPVNLFKNYHLSLVEEENISRTLHSSATTTGIPSKITLDKTTSLRQTKGLISILKSILGKKRRPYLIFDAQQANIASADLISARGAAIRGISNFAKKSVYLMDYGENGELSINFERLEKFVDEYKDQEILAFGFTYMIWTEFVEKVLIQKDLSFSLPKIKILHSGGWKKLESRKVSKDKFSNELANIFNSSSSNIHDFYGMVEQVGVIYPDCEYGYKHVPNFGDVIIRDVYSFDEVEVGEIGFIQTLSVLPTSYPGHALLTEDMGLLSGVDDCKCGRKGKYFLFQRRAEKAEIRGCGDTFAERMIKLGAN